MTAIYFVGEGLALLLYKSKFNFLLIANDCLEQKKIIRNQNVGPVARLESFKALNGEKNI